MERNYVIQLIDNLPDESAVTLADKKQINAAKAAYDALPDKNGVDATKLTKRLPHLKSWNREALARTPATASI